MASTALIKVPDIDDLGPAMLACTTRQRAFVIAMLDFPGWTHDQMAMAAGFTGDNMTLRTTASRLVHADKVQAAIQEEARKRIGASAITAASELVKIAGNGMHKDQLKAIGMILNRVGLHEKTEHAVTVTNIADDSAAIERIKALAGLLGLDAKQLLGRAGVVDAEFSEVQDDGTEGLEDLL